MKMKIISTLSAFTPLRRRALGLLLLLLLLCAFSSCRSKKQSLMTESLYMQYQRVNIEYPFDNGADKHVLSEIVSYTQREDSLSASEVLTDSTRLDTNRVYRLDEVRVETRSRFASEREGRVAVDFLIRVPKELLSDNWRMTLTPSLLLEDTVMPLPDVVLNGTAFRAFQEQGYAAYSAYERSIVSPDAYDEAFLDHAGISRDIRRRQEFFLDLYRREWEHRADYLKWRSLLEQRYRYFNLQKDANRVRLYHHYMRQGEMQKVRYRITGIDTTGLHRVYAHKFEKRARLYPHYRLHRELTPRSVPGKYRLLHANYGRWGKLDNNSLSEQDSAAIAAHRYLYGDIAENEMKKSLLEQTFRQLVPYPYRADEGSLKIDTLCSPGHNFFYLYRYDYPVSTGLKKLRVVLGSRVEAIDLSSYTLPPSDTLSYIVSSLDQLMDTTLVVKKSKVYRDVKHQLTVYFKFPANRWEFDIAYEDNRAQMDTLVNAYRGFARQGLIIDDVTMTAAASLDGNYASNAKLSQRRADALKAYLLGRYGGEMEVERTFRALSIGEDWEMARHLIRRHPTLTGKEAILQKMSRVSDPDKVEGEIRWGFKNEYKVIREEIYPLLRRVDLSFTMHRPNMEVPDSVHREYRRDYAGALRLLENKDYAGALAVLQKYADYNTALCLAGMGRRENAYTLLRGLEQTPDVQYLSAIVLYQMKRKGEAAAMLMRACAADPEKILRISRDTDMKALVREYGLQPKLDELNISF